jgi:hypothetical protein
MRATGKAACCGIAAGTCRFQDSGGPAWPVPYIGDEFGVLPRTVRFKSLRSALACFGERVVTLALSEHSRNLIPQEKSYMIYHTVLCTIIYYASNESSIGVKHTFEGEVACKH